MSEESNREKLIEEIKLREAQKKLKDGLPYLYGWKHYTWSRKFLESTNYENYLVAANQIGKSSIAIRKCIHWATATELWPELWSTELLGAPNQFWYLYPTRDVATIEFKTKWSLFLPKGEFKNHPKYGWHAEFDRKQIMALHFNTGLSVYFKTYAQNVHDLQTGTCFAIFCDEELPVPLLPELQARLNASDGYFHLVFTATLGQDYWRRCIERVGRSDETCKGAFKLNVSLFDCQKFEDGTPSHWTPEKIKRAIAKCPSKAEVQRRVYGRFVISEGLKYAAFDHERNVTDASPVPSGWNVYSGVDVGSGGAKGHPAAIVFVAVSPDYQQGRVFKAWRGDGIDTTSTDILIKYRELRGEMKPLTQVYDWASKDFFTVASRIGESFVPAEKNHEIGEGILNTLFRLGMLKLHSDDPEIEKLIGELSSLSQNIAKNKAIDDLCDALRYTCATIPWDYEAVEKEIDFDGLFKSASRPKPKPKILSSAEVVQKERETARTAWLKGSEVPTDDVEELTAWQELYDA